MKYINNNDLYFRVGDLTTDTGFTPTFTNVNYTLTIKNPATNTAMKVYDGNIFFHSLNQKVYFDFLIDSMVSDFDIEAFPYSGTTVPIVDVDFVLSAQYSATTKVARTILTDDMTESVVDNYLFPTGGTYPHIAKPQFFNCEPPRAVDGMNYPVILYTGNYSVITNSGDTIQNQTQVYKIAKNGCYSFNLPTNVNTINCKKGVNIRYDTLTVTKDCNAQYVLIWWDYQGFFQSQPFYGIENDSYTHNTVTNLYKQETKYQTQEERKWSLKSDYVHRQKTYHSLFTSPVIWLYDTQTGKYHKVLVKDSTFTERRNKKAFRFSLNVAKDNSTIYRN